MVDLKTQRRLLAALYKRKKGFIEMDNFITNDICNLKHKEVEELKDNIKDLRTCMTEKFSKLYALLFTLLGGVVLNLIVMIFGN